MMDWFTADLHLGHRKVYSVLNAGYDSHREELTPEEATEYALQLLAAAKQAATNHVEQETN